MRQIIKPVCVCATVQQCISVKSVRPLTVSKIGTDLKTSKSKNEFIESTSHHPFPYFALKPHLGQNVLKIHANINTKPYC